MVAALRLCFAGTPEFAAAHLQALLDSPHTLAAVFTQPDRPAGRGRKPTPSAVAALASTHGLPVHKPSTLRDGESARLLASLDVDAMVVAAYGLILPPQVLQIPRHGCINVHASLLPRWRGAAPIERALLAGDDRTGITIMRMDAGLDTGDILHQQEVAIGPGDDRNDVEAKLRLAGREALLYSLGNLPRLLAAARPQDNSLATYADKLEKNEAMIDWQGEAVYIARQVRAGVGRAPAFGLLGGQRLRVLRARPEAVDHGAAAGSILEAGKGGLLVACGSGALRAEIVQMPGKKAAPVRALLHSPSTPLRTGARFDRATALPARMPD